MSEVHSAEEQCSTWTDYPMSRNYPASVVEDADSQRHRLAEASARIFDSHTVRLEVLRVHFDCKTCSFDQQTLAPY